MNDDVYNKIFDMIKDEDKEFKEQFGMLKESEFNNLVKDSEGVMSMQKEIFSPRFSAIISVMTLISCKEKGELDKLCGVVDKIMDILNGEKQGIIIIALAYALCRKLQDSDSNIMEKIRW